MFIRINEELRVSREQEKEADLLAIQHVGASVGIDYFQSVKRFHRSYLKCKKLVVLNRLVHRFLFDREGSNRFSWFDTHPSSERIRSIEECVRSRLIPFVK